MIPAAFFDMDRTLVRVSTGRLFIRWRFLSGKAGLRDLLRFSSWMMQYTLGVIDPVDVTARALRHLEGIDAEAFELECRQWYRAMVRRYISDEARREVERRRRQGYVLAILSASTPYAAEPLAEDLGIDHVLCTRLVVDNGKFTGRYHHLCYGAGKVEAAERFAEAHQVDLGRSAFYTDSVSDLPMLERVGEPRIVNPDPRLGLVSRRRRWPVERWA